MTAAPAQNAAVSAAETPLRILLVTPRYFPYSGGVENHVYQVARRLAQAGVDVTVLTADPGGSLSSYEELDGVKVERVRAWPARRDYYFAPGIYRRIRQGKWDLIHVQSYHTLVAPLAMLAALRAGIPYLVTFHGGGHSSHLRKALRRVQWWLLRPLLARATSLVCGARFEIEHFGKTLHLPPSHFCFIPNGSDLPVLPEPELSSGQEGRGQEQGEGEEDSRTRITPGEGQAQVGANAPLLVASVGRLERYKGHQRLIAALPELLKLRPAARLWIAGSGPYEAVLAKQARKLGVADRVEIRAVPPADRAAMARALSQVSLVALMSEYETHPMAVLEAAALGRPVLVAANSGLKELADQGLALAIPLNSSPGQLARAIVKQVEEPVMLKNPVLLTWDDCTGELLQLYETISGRKR